MDAAADAEFSDFMAGRWSGLVRLGYGLTGDLQHAEDLAQTAFALAYASWSRVRRADDPDAYLRRIVVNANRNRFRKLRVPEVLTASLPELASAMDGVEEQHRRDALVKALLQLPHGQRRRGAAVLARPDRNRDRRGAGLLGRQRQEPVLSSPGQAPGELRPARRRAAVSIQDERDLRDQLVRLLNGVEVRPAPVTAAVHRGRRIRVRRRISVAIGLAVTVAVAAAIPAVLNTGLLAPKHYQVMVRALGPAARRNVIAEGVTDGKQWKVVGSFGVDAATGLAEPSIQAVGAIGMAVAFVATDLASPTAAEPVQFESGPSPSGEFLALFGTVSQQVTSVALQLADRERPRLTPVSWNGARWVGVVVPAGVPIVRAVAYAGARELAYSVPFRGAQFATWLQPGQAAPARVTKSIGSGVVTGRPWHAVASIGPWGWCYSVQGAPECLAGAPTAPPAGQLVEGSACWPANSVLPAAGIVFAAPEVRRVVLLFSDGTSASFRAVQVAGVRVFGYAVPANVQVTSSREFGSQGQLIGSQPGHAFGSSAGPGWTC
jgi:hypothetical protein